MYKDGMVEVEGVDVDGLESVEGLMYLDEEDVKALWLIGT